MTPSARLTAIVGLAASLLWAACGGDSTAPPEPTRIEVTPSQKTLTAIGATVQFTARVFDQNDQPMSQVEVSWSSGDAQVAGIGATTGVATARTPGTTTITAQADGASGTAQLVVSQDPASLNKVAGDGQTVAAGQTAGTPVTVQVVDSRGNGVGQMTVTFSVAAGGGSVSPGTATTGSNGRASATWTVGTTAGSTQELLATAGGGLSATFAATVEAAEAAALSRVSGDGQTADVGTTLPDPLVVRVADEFGNPVEGFTVSFAATSGGGSVSPTSADTDGDGDASAEWTLGSTVGAQAAEASASGLQGSPVSFTADATASTAPQIDSVAPGLLEPGTSAVIHGANFDSDPAANDVTVAGAPVTVDQATSSRLDVTLPTSGLPCVATSEQDVTVTVAGASAAEPHPLQVATQRDLAVGESLVLLQQGEDRCNELAQNGGRYLVSVFNTTRSAGSTSGAFDLRGAEATAGPAGPAAPRTTSTLDAPPMRGPGTGGGVRLPTRDELQRRAEAHLEWLRRDRELLERMRAGGVGAGPAGPGASRSALAVGDTLTFRIPDIGGGCTNFTEVGGRVVFDGSVAIVVEDTAAPVAGQMDSEWQARAQEYENDMHPILTGNFGDPLKLDGSLDNNGKIFMVFSEVVNDMNSVLGFVFSGDLVSASSCAASDEGEVFYGIVPTDTATDFGTTGGIGQWQRQMRSTFIHEVKHVTSNVERTSRGAPREVLWLEEATAHLAEELWTRQLYGYAQNDNVQYADGLDCEVRPTTSGCEGGPFATFANFLFLYDYMNDNEGLSPLGQASSNDNTFRGSGWWITRYAVDHSGRSESDFLNALTQESSLTGIDNITDKAGIGWETMLARWTLALLADDDPDAASVPGDFTQPSWDTRDIFGGMNSDFPNMLSEAFPLDFRPVQFGSFTESVSGGVRGGTAALFELSGTQSAKQLLHLRGQSGNPLPASLRLAIVRVE